MPEQRTPEDDRRNQVRRLVDRAVETAVDPADMTDRRIRSESDYSWKVPRPRAGLAAALMVAGMARRKAHEYAKEMRAAGTSWRELADLLEIPWSPDYARVERVYEMVAADAGSSYSSQPRLYWRCGGPGGCGEYITDYGPYNGHPDDTESGHADGCQRKTAEVAAWVRDQDERDRREKVMEAAIAKVTDEFGRSTIGRVHYVQAHGGRYGGWSTTETAAVALVLRDEKMLNQCGFRTRKAALDRVVSGTGSGRPEKPDAWLRLIRAAALGIR